MNKPTAAILCLGRNESPFTLEWLEYHFELGIDRIYFISTDTNFFEVEEFFEGSGFRSRIQLYHFDNFKPGWQIGCYNTFFPLIKEEWVLIMDIDEYLYLNAYPDVHSFLGTIHNGIGQIQFPWLILMSASYFHKHTFDIIKESKKFASDHMKSMVRRNCVTGLGIHSHGIRRLKNILSSGVEAPGRHSHDRFLSDIGYYRNFPFILHFCSRGHFDVINRITDHQFFNTKNGNTEKRRIRDYLSSDPNWENLPTRYLLMQFYRSLPTVEIDIAVPKLEAKTDVRTLFEIFQRNISKIVDFDCLDLNILDKEFERCFQLTHKLELLEFPVECNHDDYLACDSQLEYIGHLRQRLLSRQ
jgi:hypothetical protein